ncbi:glycoside hydrolase family 47 protein [Parathielavia hyrcaniae]|uniref:alpha-1,2-Mannosidase n=1 Tax=Parathielavia hyrcaniae TaxID=113614 RepID=A0AAN6SZS6_9PEZI|nr:glycoside hydrolase family 47 protein [Parathielavia hyrcaniae]
MRSLSATRSVALLLLNLAAALPHRNRATQYAVNQDRADAVKEAFQVSWDGYYRYAFPHDSLRPVTNGFADDRNGWGASAVDALSTALIMGKWDIAHQILAYIPEIDFDTTTTEVSLFETTIRYLGGLMSAYDLLAGPLNDHVEDISDVEAILSQAKRLADNLKVAFGTPSGVPDNNLFFNPPRRGGSTTNGIATIGTLVLEWTRLSDLSNDTEYADLAQRGESYLLHPQPPSGEPFPGLLGTNVLLSNGRFVDSNGGWGGGTDSFYEYLIKMYLYDPERFAEYRDRWILAADSSIEHLVSHPTTRPELTFLAMWRDKELRFFSEHLACFHGGNFILGGLTLSEPAYTNFGLALVDSCHATYASTATGIGPEIFAWQDSAHPANATNNPPAPAGQAAFYDRAGFWIANGNYVLRPEVVESYYHAFRATGDAKYQDWAWEAFERVRETCRAGSGFSSIRDVNQPGGGGFHDFQESFWFAEVLKYSYLIHAEDAPWQLKADHTNEFVYNTEAHPIRVAAGREMLRR